jgi:hypothetical protein
MKHKEMIEMVTPRSKGGAAPSHQSSSNRIIKGYELGWKARSNIFLGGRILMGPFRVSLLPLLCFIMGAVFVYYEIRKEVLPLLYLSDNSYLLTICEVLGAFFTYHFLKAAITDPGVILRHSQYEAEKISLTAEEIKKKEEEIN